MMNNYVIRKPDNNDLGQLLKLCKQHAQFEGTEFTQQGKSQKLARALFTTAPALYCFVVEYDNQLIGYTTATREFSTWDAGYFLHMDCLYLIDSARGKGLGEALMAKIKQLAIESQCSHLQWQTPADNEPAIQFYLHQGASSKSKKRFYWSL